MVEALFRVFAVFHKRLRPYEDIDDSSSPKRAKLDQDQDGQDVDGGPLAQPDPQREAGVKESNDTTQDSAESQTPDDALSLLECPVCMDTMQSPVRRCVNGHCVCNECRARVSSCPLCRGPLSRDTHTGLDHLARTLTLPCVHRRLGCPERTRVTDIESHLLECAFNSCPCPVQPCQWSGAFRRVRQHCLEVHPLVAKEASLDNVVCFSIAPFPRSETAAVLDVLVVLVEAEVFVVEMHSVPERAAVIAKQLSAGRLRPPQHLCNLTLRGSVGTPTRARVPVLTQEATLTDAESGGRCFIAHPDTLLRLGETPLTLECSFVATPDSATPGWLSWLAEKVWTRS